MPTNFLNFKFSLPTDLVFGTDSLNYLDYYLVNNSIKSVLIIRGKKSAIENGSYYDVVNILVNNKIDIRDYNYCPENPSTDFINNSKTFFSDKTIDLILAIGGGSVIDAAKAIAIYNSNDISDIWTIKDKSFSLNSNKFPLGVVLTTSGTSSEINGGFVLNNNVLSKKYGFSDISVRPNFAICNPIYTMTLSKKQTFSNLADIFSHMLEQYFDSDLEEITIIDHTIIGFIRGLYGISYKLIDGLNSYQNRYELMLSSSLALSYIFSLGKKLHWTLHHLEHELSGMYEIPHGTGIAALTVGYIRYLEAIEFNNSKIRFINKQIFNNNITLSKNIEIWFQDLELPSNLNHLSEIYNFEITKFKEIMSNIDLTIFKSSKLFSSIELMDFF